MRRCGAIQCVRVMTEWDRGIYEEEMEGGKEGKESGSAASQSSLRRLCLTFQQRLHPCLLVPSIVEL